MAGFIRRFSFFPPVDVITEIEGVVIVDLPPPGAVNGVGVGTTAIVGEFVDMTYAVEVNPATGAVSTKPIPVEIFSSQDMIDKVGGFDETLGEFGKAGGNGYASLRNKRFSRLVAVPINLASGFGARLWRQLPTNNGSTDPTPAVDLVAASVGAGREFKTGTSRVRTAAPIAFTGDGEYLQGTDGSVTAVGAAVTQMFSSATGGFLTAKDGGPVKEGDLLVLGQIGGAGGLGANADTYRVTADATVDTQLTVEKLDGASFDWTTIASLPFRIHPASDGDTGADHQLSEVAGYLVPARPLDATIATATSLSPTLTPPAPTATSWDPLSGLTLRTDPTNGLTYTAAVQAENAANSSDLDALYDTAVDSLLGEELPQREVNIVFASRHSSTIRTKLKSHVLESSGLGVGRVAVISPELDQQTVSTIIGDAAPGVGATRSERVFYAWPGCRTFVREAVGYALGTADGLTTDDGILDQHMDAWLASLLSNLAPERNPGQASAPVPTVMAPVQGIQRGVTGLGITQYKQFRAKGVVALRIDRTSGPIFQSGVTSSLISGEKNINRRRMADFIQDSLAARYNQFSKQPLSNALKDAVVGETDAFLNQLLSPNNPPAQRIAGYTVDDVSGNTPDLEAKGIFVVISKVRTLATGDFLVVQTEVGEGVEVTVT